jgi:hypothetical protein
VKFNAAANVQLRKLPAAEQRYHAITSRIQEYLKSQRQIVNNPDASFKRSQISNLISQGVFTTDQVHSEVQSVQWDFNTNAEPLMKQVTEAEQVCRAHNLATSGIPVPPGTEGLNSECLKFLDAVIPYRLKFNAVARALAHLEEAYQQERKNQEQLVRESHQVQ